MSGAAPSDGMIGAQTQGPRPEGIDPGYMKFRV